MTPDNPLEALRHVVSILPEPVAGQGGAIGYRLARFIADPASVEAVARELAKIDGADPDEPAFVRYPGPVEIGICWRDKYANKALAILSLIAERGMGEP